MNKSFLSVIVASVAAIIIGLAAANAYKYKFRTNENISVTGSAAKEFTSDLIVWQGNYTRKSMDLKDAYEGLKQDEQKIKQFLLSKGISDKEMVFSSADINRDYNDQYDKDGRKVRSTFTGFTIKQTIKIESKDVEKVENISREVTQLIEQGLELYSQEPSYYFSKLADLKISLLEKAAADCRLRAETIAKQSKTSLGGLRKSTMGVFQITGQNSNEDFSYGGAYNTTSKFKTASVSIKMEFATD